MAVITKQQLEDASRDATDLGLVMNGAADLNGTGLVTTRLGATVRTISKLQADILAANRYVALTWTALAAITDRLDGAVAEVPASDAGTHTDPVVGGTVNNAGIYRYKKTAPIGWQRIANLDSVSAAPFATAAANSAVLSQAWAEGTLPGGPGTDSAKNWATIAQSYYTTLGLTYPTNMDRRLQDVEATINQATLAYSLAAYEQTRANDLERRLAAVESGGVASWIIAARIEQHGWQIEIDVALSRAGGTFDKTKIAVTVYDMGFDENNQPVIRPRTLTPTRVCRKPSPNQAQNDEVLGTVSTWTLSLPKQVFAKAKAGTGNSGFDPVISVQAGWYTVSATAGPAQSLTMVNNSTEPYPKPVFRNALPPRRRLGATGLFEVTGNGFNPMLSRTAACARLELTGVTSGRVRIVKVASMVASTYYAKRTNASPVFQASVDMTYFTQGEEVTERWRIYPFIGDSAAILDSAAGAYLSGTFCNYNHLVDHAGTWGRIYAVVDPVNGNNTTGAASAVSEAAAAATPFLDERKACYAAQLLNNSTYGRNHMGGIEICFVDNTAHKLTMAKSDFNAPNVVFASEDANVGPTWCVYRPRTGATNCSLTRDTSVTTGRCWPRRTVMRGFTQVDLNSAASGSSILFDGGETTTGSYGQELWLDGVPLVNTGGNVNNSNAVGIYQAGMVFLTNATHTALDTNLWNFGNVRTEYPLIRDTDFNTRRLPTGIWAWVGVAATMLVANGATGGIGPTPSALTAHILPNDGNVWAGVSLRTNVTANSAMVWNTGSNNVTVGIAMLNVLIESWANSQPAMQTFGDGVNYRFANFFADYLTVVGNRINIGYEDTFVMTDDGDPEQQLKKLMMIRRSVIRETNTKTDLFGTANGARIHTWNVAHHVGWEYVRRLEADSSGGTAPGNGIWSGEAWPSTETYIGPDARSAFTNYQADHRAPAVTGAGNGNYMPTSTSVLLNIVPEGERACGIDIVGNARSGEVGAYAYAP